MGGSETGDPLSQLSMPPGYRFHPTDEELMVNYLCPKVARKHYPLEVIGEIDLYKYDPWELPGKALLGETEWYFFTPRDRKYPNGLRPNRVAGKGYWKATGTDKAIRSAGKKVGIKKALVFYIGKAPRGSKTNWIMHEYRLLEPQRGLGNPRLDDWVLCRIYKKTTYAQRAAEVGIARPEGSHGSSSSSSQFDDPLQLAINNDRSFTVNHLNDKPTVQIQNVGYSSGNTFDWATFTVGLNNTVPEHDGGSSSVQFPIQNGSQQGVMNTIHNYNQNEMYVASMNTGYGRMIEQEVQSGFTNQQAENSVFFNPNARVQGFINLLDPYAAMHYPNQPDNPGNRN